MPHRETSLITGSYQTPSIGIDIVEPEGLVQSGRLRCDIGKHVTFSTEHLESYCFASWEPVIYDVLLVAAAVEFADRTQRRSAMKWDRQIELRIPVHDPDRWNDTRVFQALHETLNFLTGDQWNVCFYRRGRAVNAPQQGRFDLPADLATVIPFSDGLDSFAVGGLMSQQLGNKLIRVRLGSKRHRNQSAARPRQPFTSVPYRVRPGARPFAESSARSRGFKFALISGLAAYLAKAHHVIVPESGQGALGPALVTVGQAYEDYRSHPSFTCRMEIFIKALLGHQVRYTFPQLWETKSETLRKFINQTENPSWSATWSCWQQNRHSSVNGKRRHCGICAACMLRRLSVHAAGLAEPAEAYVWENLGATSFWQGAS